MAEKAILFDTSRCTGCHACQIACKCWNNLPSPTGLNENKFSGTHQNPPDLNGQTRLIMTYHESEGTLPTKTVQWAFGRRACQHCTDAPCASICPAGAICKDEATGMVTTDNSKCVACQYCSTACPFDVPRYDGVQGTINKCTGCVDRIEQGMPPACVTTCQPEALAFGDRDEMLAEAEKRLEMLKQRGYENAVIYGAEEMGGLHVIQVLKYGVEAHGQVANPTVSPVTTLTNLMKPVTGVVSGVTVLGLAAMFGLAAGYKRDKVVYNAETEDTISLITGDVVKHGDGQDTTSVKDHILENLPGKKGGDHE
ncbi:MULTISPECIES: 4Fe-4S dicluster domain-containing protein [unclassified Adlercreutzia]|uniref:4Fe-4S dicluster domain-containing protein n=1 Tax=unclassified Adlercreutzia TaxID=2636013 RepID=UPI0013EB93CA|nr:MULTISPECIES: 4Fe-4S dicluster domain-containing protein [unclassified Adlercreutzia]